MPLTRRDAMDLRDYWSGLELALDDLANGCLDRYEMPGQPTCQSGYDDMKACFVHETKTEGYVYRTMESMMAGAPHNLRFKYEGRMDWVVPSEQPPKKTKKRGGR